MLKKIELPLQWIIFHIFVIHFTAKKHGNYQNVQIRAFVDSKKVVVSAKKRGRYLSMLTVPLKAFDRQMF